MTVKNKIYLSLSIIVFFSNLMMILTSDKSIGIIDSSLPFKWIVIFVGTIFLLFTNITEIIVNRDDWGKYYWIGLIFNILTVIFIIRYFKIELIDM